MSELPRTDDLPRAEDGYDAARVEDAFSAFAARVHDLEEVAAELRDEVRALRNERGVPPDDEDWPDTGVAAAPSPDWVAFVPPPLARPFAVPRLAVEAAFLLAVALLAGLANLDAVWIVLVMAAAWVLVALSEWSAAAKRARWRLDEIPPGLEPTAAADSETTGPWSMPVVEATVVETADVSESRTVIAALPATPEPDPPADTDAEPAVAAAEALEDTGEQKPPRRRFRLRRNRGAPGDAPDPWEQ